MPLEDRSSLHLSVESEEIASVNEIPGTSPRRRCNVRNRDGHTIDRVSSRGRPTFCATSMHIQAPSNLLHISSEFCHLGYTSGWKGQGSSRESTRRITGKTSNPPRDEDKWVGPFHMSVTYTCATILTDNCNCVPAVKARVGPDGLQGPDHHLRWVGPSRACVRHRAAPSKHHAGVALLSVAAAAFQIIGRTAVPRTVPGSRGGECPRATYQGAPPKSLR